MNGLQKEPHMVPSVSVHSDTQGGRFLISVTSFFCQKIILNKRKLLIIYVTYEINTCFHLNCWWSLSICVHMLPIWGSTLCVNNLTISLNHSIEDTYFDLIKNDMLHIFDINGGFQSLDLIIPELKSHVIPYKFKCSHWWKTYL